MCAVRAFILIGKMCSNKRVRTRVCTPGTALRNQAHMCGRGEFVCEALEEKASCSQGGRTVRRVTEANRTLRLRPSMQRWGVCVGWRPSICATNR
mgnify:CR=1 FL=1|jgi:hypothetical protein